MSFAQKSKKASYQKNKIASAKKTTPALHWKVHKGYKFYQEAENGTL